MKKDGVSIMNKDGVMGIRGHRDTGMKKDGDMNKEKEMNRNRDENRG